jgi:hypothetical protein
MQDTVKTSYLAAELILKVINSDYLVISSSFLPFSNQVRLIAKANKLSDIQPVATNKNEKVS